MNNEKIKNTDEGTILKIKVVANATQNEFVEQDEFFKVRIKAPAVDNKANLELTKFLSEHFDVPKSAVVILHGSKSTQKTVLIKNFIFKK